ncbi:MAG: homoserine dehydrogenase, partial [Candidatus Eremiobacterota bacterium]
AHLSRDQVLIKVVGDGIGANHEVLARIHQSIDAQENPDKYGAPLVHKSPQLLTDSTFEFVALKRGARELILRLYKDLFDRQVLRVGLIGLGTVGGGMLDYARELYSREKTGVDLQFPVAVVKNLKKKRPGFAGLLTKDAAAVLENPQIDVVVELMGGIEPARSYILTALRNGKHVITANKAVLAEHGPEIFETARKARRNLGFEGSVCGEIPVIEVVQGMPSDQDVESITGILNGTSNYLLTRMADGSDYEDALREAQESGFAEADPTLDVSGADAAQKLSILASLVFHTPVNWRDIRLQGIDTIRAVDTAEAARLGLSLRPVSVARRHAQGLELWVGPALVSPGHSLYSVRRETNAVSLRLRGREEPFTLVGKGAGALPTARSVLRDVIEIARRERFRMVDIPAFHEAEPVPVLSHAGERYPWWVRFTVRDQPGVFGAVAALLGTHGLSIRQANQQEGGDGLAHIMLALKPSSRETLDRALEGLAHTDVVVGTLAVPVL